jgi:hypothetical protein
MLLAALAVASVLYWLAARRRGGALRTGPVHTAEETAL